MAAHLPCLPVFAFLSLVFLIVHVPASHGSPDSLPTTYDSSMCPESFLCGSVHVHYPFYLSNGTRYTANYTRYSCGYTDLEIFCQGEGPTGIPIIRFRGDNYTVKNIFYEEKTIVLADSNVLGPVKCPVVSHEVSFDELWLRLNPGSNDNLTFYFGCKSLDRVPPGLDTYQIDCNGFKSPFGDGPTFVFTPDDLDKAHEQELVMLCYNFSVPVSGEALAARNRTNITHGGYGEVLKQGFELVWLSNSTYDECLRCEQSGGKCAYNEYREFLGCLCSKGKVVQQHPFCTNDTGGYQPKRRKEQKETTSSTYLSSHGSRATPPLLLAVLVAACRGDDYSGDAYNISICQAQPYRCGKVEIRYPFYLSGVTGDVRNHSNSCCGYPGLAIACEDGREPTLRLNDTDYNVTGIDYSNHIISLVDPDVLEDESCPRVDHNVTVPSYSWLNYTEDTIGYLLFFANCSIFTLPNQSDIKPIECASSDGGREYSFVIPLNVPHLILLEQCQQVTLVPVLQSALEQGSTDGYRNTLTQGFQLEWELGRRSNSCVKCDNSNGRCAYNQDGVYLGCLCANGRVNDQGCLKVLQDV
nr:unnamed protein product [Digitaria exilis]